MGKKKKNLKKKKRVGTCPVPTPQNNSYNVVPWHFTRSTSPAQVGTWSEWRAHARNSINIRTYLLITVSYAIARSRILSGNRNFSVRSEKTHFNYFTKLDSHDGKFKSAAFSTRLGRVSVLKKFLLKTSFVIGFPQLSE